MTRAIPLAAAFVVVLLAAAEPARAATVAFQVNDLGDFTPYAALNTGQSFSGTGFVGIYPNNRFAHLFGFEGGSYLSRTLLQIDISSLAGSTVSSAQLMFDLWQGSDLAQDVTVTSFSADGNLGYFWTPPDSLGSEIFAVDGRATNALDITSLLQQRIDSGADWLGLHLQGSSANQWTWTHGASGYGPDEAGVRLIVDFSPAPTVDPLPAAVPEPSAFTTLAVTALVAGLFAAWRCRREKNQAAT